MKKLLVVLPILLLIVLEGTSQTSKDTVHLPIEQVKKAISIIEVSKVQQEELVLTKKALQVAENRLVLKDSVIYYNSLKDKMYLSIIDGYKKNLSNSDQIISNLEHNIKVEQRNTRVQKVYKWIALAGGLTAGFFISK
jgi:hypothetical protein